ncbi:MAG: hypothetical protein SOT16_02245 [Oscillospiraceae bacterium]|nr:hypothetical protein [Oscillospiraceae bacterium]
MKNVKRIAALLLALVMVFALCACSDSGSGKDKDKGEKVEKKTDAELIVGTWETEMSMTDYYGDDMGELEGMEAYFDFDKIKITMTFEFEEDGTYTMSVDGDEAEIKAILRDGFEKLLNDMLEGTGYTLEDAAAEEGMTADEYLDALMEESFGSGDLIDVDDELGEYKVKNGKLYLFDEGDELDEGTYYEYKLKGDKLTLVAEYEDGETTEASDTIFPLDFVRK